MEPEKTPTVKPVEELPRYSRGLRDLAPEKEPRATPATSTAQGLTLTSGGSGDKTWQTVKGYSNTVERIKGSNPTPLSNAFLVLEEGTTNVGSTDGVQILVAEPHSTRESVTVQVPGIGTLNTIRKRRPRDS